LYLSLECSYIFLNSNIPNTIFQSFEHIKYEPKSLVIAVTAMFAMVATIALATPQAFAQNVTNKGEEEEEDDDTTNISSTPTKVKSDANCNMGGFANWCDENESEAEIEVEE
jgi:hypothetical protein